MPRRDHVNPFFRYKPEKFNTPGGVNPIWAAWLETYRNKFVRIIDHQNRLAPDVVLYIAGPAGSNKAINLTNLSEQELDALQQFINETIDLARPVVLLRDKETREANEPSDQLDARINRRLPKVSVQSWARGIDSTSILHRSTYVAAADAIQRDIDAGLRRDSGTVVESDPQDSKA